MCGESRRWFTISLFIVIVFLWEHSPAVQSAQVRSEESPPSLALQKNYRWWGYDFVFCFITDDGTGCNEGWIEVALARGFRFTLGINAGRIGLEKNLDADQLALCVAQGFEIANHTTTHANNGMVRCTGDLLPPACDELFGDLRGYFSLNG